MVTTWQCQGKYLNAINFTYFSLPFKNAATREFERTCLAHVLFLSKSVGLVIWPVGHGKEVPSLVLWG